MFSGNEQAHIAELTWTLKLISSNFSAESLDDCGAVFHKMFPEAVPDSFYFFRTKFSYLLKGVLDLYFHKEVLHEASSVHYSFIYDEITNNSSNIKYSKFG